MPFRDGTGPFGKGRRFGFGNGPCAYLPARVKCKQLTRYAIGGVIAGSIIACLLHSNRQAGPIKGDVNGKAN